VTITIDYPYSQIIPDELEYLKFLVHKVSNNFLENEINFYITNNRHITFKTKNNVVFLSGNENNCILEDNNFILCFNNFYRKILDARYHPFPLGTNKFIFEIRKKYKPVEFDKRKYDIFFAGCIHPSRQQFKSQIQLLKCEKYLHFSSKNNLQSFENDLSPDEYLQIAFNSKIICAPRGAHHISTYRYFESILSKSISIIDYNDDENIYFEEKNPLCIKIKNWIELNDDMISNLINDYNNMFTLYDDFFNQYMDDEAIVKRTTNIIKCSII